MSGLLRLLRVALHTRMLDLLRDGHSKRARELRSVIADIDAILAHAQHTTPEEDP